VAGHTPAFELQNTNRPVHFSGKLVGGPALSQHDAADIVDGWWHLIRAPIPKLCLSLGAPHNDVVQSGINLDTRLTTGPTKQRVDVIWLNSPAQEVYLGCDLWELLEDGIEESSTKRWRAVQRISS
jgi:hypothetical protein